MLPFLFSILPPRTCIRFPILPSHASLFLLPKEIKSFGAAGAFLSLRATFFSSGTSPPSSRRRGHRCGYTTNDGYTPLLLLKIKPCATQSWLGARSNRASQMAMMFLYEMNAPFLSLSRFPPSFIGDPLLYSCFFFFYSFFFFFSFFLLDCGFRLILCSSCLLPPVISRSLLPIYTTTTAGEPSSSFGGD